MIEEELAKLHFSGAPRIVVTPPGPRSKALFKKQAILEAHPDFTPRLFPAAMKAGKGATLRDIDGNLFIDWWATISVLNIGRSHPAIVKAIKDQVEKIVHVYFIPTEPRIKFLKKVNECLPYGLRDHAKIYFSITGSDSVELATKIARFYTKRNTIICFEGAYHGVHTGALWLSAGTGVKKKSVPEATGIFRVPYAYCYRCPFGSEYPDCGMQCLSFVRHFFEDTHSGLQDPCAIIVEAIQGEGGFIVPPREFLPGLREICNEYDIILIDDEVQAGVGRTGKMWACEHTDTTPDIMCVSKSIGAGIPLAIVIVKDEIEKKLPDSIHAGTFRANTLGCAAGYEALRYITEKKLVNRTANLGEYTLKNFKDIAEESKYIGDVRGKGFMIGIEFVKEKESKTPFPDLVKRLQLELFRNGLMMISMGHFDNCLRFLPPLTITRELIDKGLNIFRETLSRVERTI